MPEHFIMYYDSKYSGIYGSYENTFFTMEEAIKISSPLQYFKNDVVEVVGITEDEIRVIPVADPSQLEVKPDKILVFMTTTISLSEDSQYTFHSKHGIQVLLVKEVVKQGNKRYLLFAAVPNDKPVSLLSGVDKATGTRIEFIVTLDQENSVKEVA